MKYLLIPLIIVINTLACSLEKENKVEKKDPCMSGFILIVYIGENSAPTPAVLMRTDVKDSTYYRKFVGDGREMFLKNDFIINESWEKYYLNKFTINENNYSIVKKYIIEHNTRKSKVEYVEDYSSSYPFKIILLDDCDSVAYVVDNRDTGYFKQLMDSTALFKDEKLQYRLDYFRRIQDNK